MIFARRWDKGFSYKYILIFLINMELNMLDVHAHNLLQVESKASDPLPHQIGHIPETRGHPDRSGYTFSNQNGEECDYNFINIITTGTFVFSGDDVSSGPIILAEPFEFYNVEYTTLVMASNGYISTDPLDTGPDLSNDCPLPMVPSTGGGARMYPLHDDLISEGYVQHFSDCPRPSGFAPTGNTETCTIFQWANVTHFGGGGETFEMETILYHRSGVFVFQIGPGNPEQGSGSTTGIQNSPLLTPDEFTGLTYACDTPGSIQDETAICFFPSANPFSPFRQIKMGALLNKPYTEFEFMGMTYALENLKGGHNAAESSVVALCQTNPPIFDDATGQWRIPVTNNFVQFSEDKSPLGRIRMGSQHGCEGYLEFVNPVMSIDDLDFPVRSIFTFHVYVELIDIGITLFSEEHITVRADNLMSWPPPVGTVYFQDEDIELVAEKGGPTIAILKPDTTVITEILQPSNAVPTLSKPSFLILILLLTAIAILLIVRNKQVLSQP